MITLIKKVLFLTPFLLFFIGADRYSSKNITETIKIKDSDCLGYSTETITASPGEEIQILLTARNNLPEGDHIHRFVLIKDVVNKGNYGEIIATLTSNDLIARDMRREVISYTDLVNVKDTDAVRFSAPLEPGTYSYACTLPGHCETCLRGILIVERRGNE